MRETLSTAAGHCTISTSSQACNGSEHDNDYDHDHDHSHEIESKAKSGESPSEQPHSAEAGDAQGCSAACLGCTAVVQCSTLCFPAMPCHALPCLAPLAQVSHAACDISNPWQESSPDSGSASAAGSCCCPGGSCHGSGCWPCCMPAMWCCHRTSCIAPGGGGGGSSVLRSGAGGGSRCSRCSPEPAPSKADHVLKSGASEVPQISLGAVRGLLGLEGSGSIHAL